MHGRWRCSAGKSNSPGIASFKGEASEFDGPSKRPSALPPRFRFRLPASFIPGPTSASHVCRPKVGARCGKSARRVLSGGRPERAVPTGMSLPRGWRRELVERDELLRARGLEPTGRESSCCQSLTLVSAARCRRSPGSRRWRRHDGRKVTAREIREHLGLPADVVTARPRSREPAAVRADTPVAPLWGGRRPRPREARTARRRGPNPRVRDPAACRLLELTLVAPCERGDEQPERDVQRCAISMESRAYLIFLTRIMDIVLPTLQADNKHP